MAGSILAARTAGTAAANIAINASPIGTARKDSNLVFLPRYGSFSSLSHRTALEEDLEVRDSMVICPRS